MAKVKSTEGKRDFIAFISSMSDTEINDYIKSHGKPPKKIEIIQLVDKSSRSLEEWLKCLNS